MLNIYFLLAILFSVVMAWTAKQQGMAANLTATSGFAPEGGMSTDSWKPANIYLLALIGLIMVGCGGGGGGAPIPTYSISGSVTSAGVGLQGTAVTLTGVRTATY